VGVPSSILGCLLTLVAFTVVVILRYANLVLDQDKPETTSTHKGKETPMAHRKLLLSSLTETAWALGTNMLAGLPLLT
jgi:hypothetical protein